MDFLFNGLTFTISDGRIGLDKCGIQNTFDVSDKKLGNFVEIQIAGENKDSHYGNKMICSSEGCRLRYVSHTITENRLEIVQKSELIEAKTVFDAFPDTNAVSVYTEVKNISDSEFIIEEASALVLTELAGGLNETPNTYLYKFTQSHHGECQPRRYSLYDLGLFRANPISQKRVSGGNIGSWSTKEELPQGIVEYNGCFTMFQIESNNSWYWEISDKAEDLYLYLGGANIAFGGWYKKLLPFESYKAVSVDLCFGDSLSGVIGEMTKYRRHIKGRCLADENLPTIFNEYMHLSWDSPSEGMTKIYAPTAAFLGIKFYVIDCGWHNEEPGSEIYPYVGQWKESKARFPHGLRRTAELIRSLGMNLGLWIEPEIVGYKCREMLDYYDDDCFIRRHGKKVCVMGRYFLDFRNPKVISYMNESIRRMVEDYGAAYIKMDYNEDLGVGTELQSCSFGEGLEQCAKAYLAWVDSLRARFPNVLFETCSSGGMRMDYETLKHFSIISTSDQTDYKKYPYIAGNILSAVLPEQAVVWSYPVDSYDAPNSVFCPTAEWVEEHISSEQVIMNMVNSFLGRMHLASHLELLSNEKLLLVKEGIEYFDSISEWKKSALPYFPIGFTDFSAKFVASGLKLCGRILLAVWNLDGEKRRTIELEEKIHSVKITYPKAAKAKVAFIDKNLIVDFSQPFQAMMIEIFTE